LQRRYFAGTAVDSEVLVFGGIDSSNNTVNNLIRFRGNPGDGVLQSELVDLPNAPPGRLFASMAFDADDDTVFVFGGKPTTAAGATLDDLWKLELYRAH
jgi:hypothetical protein